MRRSERGSPACAGCRREGFAQRRCHRGPIPLDIPGQEHAVTSEEFLELEGLPARIVLVGGGYIAAEFSHLAARAGVHVTVLQRAERMLPAFDPDLVGWLMEKFGELGIDVRTRTTVRRIDKTAGGFVVHAAGREPDLTALDLAAGGRRNRKRSSEAQRVPAERIKPQSLRGR